MNSHMKLNGNGNSIISNDISAIKGSVIQSNVVVDNNRAMPMKGEIHVDNIDNSMDMDESNSNDEPPAASSQRREFEAHENQLKMHERMSEGDNGMPTDQSIEDEEINEMQLETDRAQNQINAIRK